MAKWMIRNVAGKGASEAMIEPVEKGVARNVRVKLNAVKKAWGGDVEPKSWVGVTLEIDENPTADSLYTGKFRVVKK